MPPIRKDEEPAVPDDSSDSQTQNEVDSRFRLVLLAAQRSKQLQRGAKPRVDIDPTKHKSTRIALEEVVVGKVNFGPRDRSEQKQNLIPEQEYVALALIGQKIKLVSLSLDGRYKFLDETASLHDFLYVDSLETSNIQDAIGELEDLVNSPKAKERDFQDFFTRNKDFILNDEYKNAHAHLVFTSEDGESLVPDSVLEPIEQGALCDVLELKLPSARLFTLKKNRMRYSAAVAEAAAQLREYGRFFEEERNRRQILAHYGLRAYKPKMFVIIGRRSILDPLDERSIQSDYPNLYLRTYDDIINRMKHRAERLMKGPIRPPTSVS